jgi:hypothetical protein
MKNQIFSIVLFLLTTTGVAQPDKTVDSKIKNVTVFLSNAQVTREAKTRIDAGKTSLTVTGLTSQLDQEREALLFWASVISKII